MKTFLIFLVSILPPSVFANTFRSETAGKCIVYTNNRSDILQSVQLPFQFPKIASLKSPNGHFYEFGEGEAVVDQTIEMMDLDKSIIRKPFKIVISVEVSADQLRKKMKAMVTAFNIFSRKMEKLNLESGRSFDVSIEDGLAYFQLGFFEKNTNSDKDAVQGTNIFCNLE